MLILPLEHTVHYMKPNQAVIHTNTVTHQKDAGKKEEETTINHPCMAAFHLATLPE